MKNPFEEVLFYTSNDEIYNKLFSAALIWTMTINDEKDLTDENLEFIFISKEIPINVRLTYEILRKGKGIDIKALKNALESWVFSA